MNACAASIGSLSGIIAFVAVVALIGFALMAVALRGAHEKIATMTGQLQYGRTERKEYIDELRTR